MSETREERWRDADRDIWRHEEWSGKRVGLADYHLKAGTKLLAVITTDDEELVTEILADHRLAAVAREAAAEAIRELDIIREKRCTCPHDYFHGDHHYQYCPGSDASKAASSQLWMSLNRVAYTLRSLTPPEGETAAGEKGNKE